MNPMSALSSGLRLPKLLFVAALCLIAPTSLHAADVRDDILRRGKSLYSQGNEELVIRHFFGDTRDGFFVDVGAYRPIEFSTTYYLEKHLGWSGIALDAVARLKSSYTKHRPKTRFFAYIVTDHSGTLDPFYLSGALSSTDEEHLDHFDAAKSPPKEVLLPSITLNDLLDREGVEKIDLLSMDIEGGAPAALAGFDIERFHPELVCIEASSAVPLLREKLLAYFAEHAYERIDSYLEHDRINWYFQPKPKLERERTSGDPHP